jgi:hypothetical protein
VKVPALPPTSRYAAVVTAVHQGPDGEELIHFRRRFIPPADRFQTIEEHTVIEGQRPDTLAARFLGDPESWWRICDANGVMRPEELTETPGRRIRITLPEGMAGAAGA